MIEYGQIGVALVVGATACIGIMAMLQLGSRADDEIERGGGQVPRQRPNKQIADATREAYLTATQAPPSPLTARADTARLDWLQHTGAGVTLASTTPRTFAVVSNGSGLGAITGDVRMAIDTAMQYEGELSGKTK